MKPFLEKAPEIVFLVQGKRSRGLRDQYWYGNTIHFSRDEAEAAIKNRDPKKDVSYSVIAFKR